MSNTALDVFAPVHVTVEQRPDGSVLMRSADDLRPYKPSMAHVFRDRSGQHPDRTLAAQRDRDGDW